MSAPIAVASELVSSSLAVMAAMKAEPFCSVASPRKSVVSSVVTMFSATAAPTAVEPPIAKLLAWAREMPVSLAVIRKFAWSTSGSTYSPGCV